jgi:cytidylate kinase
MTEKICSVAIDGPSGAGKSTIARKAAERFGFLYVDTGAIYRTVGLAVRRAGIEPADTAGIAALLPGLKIKIAYGGDGEQQMFLGGENVSQEIRKPEISLYASVVSAIPTVRAYLLAMQRDLAKNNSVVMDGRDIGTVVLPDAGLKIYLTASPKARAKRRFLEMQAKCVPCTLEQVMADMIKRDANDSTRAVAPLKPADDAEVVDTTYMELNESIEFVCRMIKGRFSL